ncbi:MAG: ABC transporter ATP-binding protein [Acetobacteraceae bacterium]|nr:ABC transporter ATP-binding protein [Acetobacteraceae bacterium]
MRGEAPGHLAIERVVKRFGSFTALDGVTLSAARGEVLTLLGPSGCGKTTLLRVIAGFLQPDAGAVAVGGRSLNGVPPNARNLGMVFQNYAVFPHLSVAENVAYGLRARRLPAGEIARRVEHALRRVRLSGLADRYPDALSGGQKQRVGLARAMVIEPELLLMDEPLSNLDAKLRVEMRQEIRLMQRELGITTVYVTHDQEEALAISDRIAVMEKGRILQVGSPREIYEQPAHAFVADFIGGCTWFDGVLGGGVLSLAAGPRIPCPGPAQPARLALRWEDLRLATDADPPEHCLPARVAMASYLGHRTRLRLVLEPSGAELHADLPSHDPLPPEGSVARFAFDPARARVFGADGTRLA